VTRQTDEGSRADHISVASFTSPAMREANAFVTDAFFLEKETI